MCDKSVSFGISFQDPSITTHSPINKNGMKLVSTPINQNEVLDGTDLDPICLTDVIEENNDSYKLNNTNHDIDNTDTQSNIKLHSILKNSPHKSYESSIPDDSNITNNTGHTNSTSVSESLLRKHPGLRMATGSNGEINPVKGARVIFSPTNEIRSYRNDFLSDDDVNFPPTQVLKGRSKKINLNKDKARVILSEGVYDEANAQFNIDKEEYGDNSENNEFINLTNNDTYTTNRINDHNIYENIRHDTNGKRAKSKTSSSSFVTKLITDPNVPFVLSLYLQLFLNLILISFVLYAVYIFIKTIKSDINSKLEMYTMDALQEISLCSREYYRNRCSLENGNKRAPALEKTCTVWNKCMNRDPQLIGKSKISAETFAEIINGFLKPISWKSLIFMNSMIFSSLFITNIAFGSYRNSSNYNNNHKDNNDNDMEFEDLQNKSREQEKLIMKYKELLDNQNLVQNTPTFNRLQSPNNFTDQQRNLIRHNQNPNSSYPSPLQNKRSKH